MDGLGRKSSWHFRPDPFETKEIRMSLSSRLRAGKQCFLHGLPCLNP